jgi:predicted GNAT family acetyltransferase
LVDPPGDAVSVVPEVRDNPAEQRFEIWVGTERAGELVYRSDGGKGLPLMHTEIDEKFGGQGLGTILIREALDTARAQHQFVMPYCPFVKAFIQKHPDYVDLVPESARSTFGLPAPS